MYQPSREKLTQFARFCLVGVVASALHYAVYCLVQLWATSAWWLGMAYTVGYVVSLVANFYMTTYFTFRSRPSAGRVAGFGLSHVVNYCLHMLLFGLLVWLGVHRLVAPVIVLAVAVPVNFTLLRHFYMRGHKS